MSFIFMASPTRTVENGSILGFHYADSYDVAYLSPRFGTEGVNVQSRVDGPVRNVYRAAGISEDLLIHQGTMLEPICWTEMSRDRSNKSLVYRYGIWMPTTANMKAWNIDFTGAPLADILPNGPLNESGQKLIAMKLGETKPGVLPAVVIGGPNKSASSSTRDKIDRCGPNLVTKVVH
ncbi:MAG TPA: hypothetical protein DIU09_08910 [Hyphomonadaceae bacterium]|nr:hypothetical protein [Hyphomonadaceae bacterium]